MNKERINELRQDYKSVLKKLEEALNEDLSKGDIIYDGTIKRFEFTFEMAWKLAMAILKYNGIEASSPRMVIKEAFRADIIKDGDAWIDMLESRNKSAHIYDEEQARSIYANIKSKYGQLLKGFCISTEQIVKSI